MPTHPIGATPGSGWNRDSTGMLMPMGGSVSAKELQQLPKEMREIAMAANTLIRGNFSPTLWPDLAMLNAIAPRHRLTQVFIASVTAGSMAQRGAASKKFLMGITNMLAPGMLDDEDEKPYNRGKALARFRKEHKNGKEPDDE